MTTWVACLIGIPLGVALASGIVIAIVVRHGLGEPVKAPGWSVTSWASNLSGVGAVLAGVVAGTSLPSTAHPLDQGTIVALAAFFVFLAFLAPFVFQCARRLDAKPNESGGTVLTLILACSLTIAAAGGQLLTLGLLYSEMVGGGDWGRAALGVAAALAVLALYYYWATVPQLASPAKEGEKKSYVQKEGWSLL